MLGILDNLEIAKGLVAGGTSMISGISVGGDLIIDGEVGLARLEKLIRVSWGENCSFVMKVKGIIRFEPDINKGIEVMGGRYYARRN